MRARRPETGKTQDDNNFSSSEGARGEKVENKNATLVVMLVSVS
jgi:hypothetical protein